MKKIIRKKKGQEIVEFALLGAIIFLGALFTMLAFSKQLSNFFSNSSMSKGPKVASMSPSNNNPTAAPTTTITIDIGGNQSIDVEVPSGSYYLQTTGSSGDQREIISNLGQYTSDLADALDTVASKVNNNSLNSLIEAIKNTGSLEKGVLGYDTTGGTQSPARWSIDPNGDIGQQINSVIKSLDVSFNQLSNEDSRVGVWSNDITEMNQQNDFARSVRLALAKVNADSSLSTDVKTLANSLAGEVQNVADNYSYSVDSNKYDASYSDLSSLYSSVESASVNNKVEIGTLANISSDILSGDTGKYSSDLVNFVLNTKDGVTTPDVSTTLKYVVDGTSLKIELPTLASSSATSEEKANSVVNLMNTLKNLNETGAINNLSPEAKQKITDLVNSMQIKVNSPEQGAVNTNLAADILNQLN